MKSIQTLLLELYDIDSNVEYGTDGKDRQFQHKTIGTNKTIFTNFVYEDTKVKMIFYTGDSTLTYGVYDDKTDKWYLRPSESPITFKQMGSFYTKLISIAVEMIKKYNLTKIVFIAAEPRLDRTYNTLFNSTSIKRLLNSLGFVGSKATRNNETFYVFSKD